MALPRALLPLALLGLTSAVFATIPAPDPSTRISDTFPSVNGEIFAIAAISDELGSGTVFVVGKFSSVRGISRNNAAAFDIETGAVTAWNPDVNGPVHAIVVSGQEIYLGGSFTNAGGQPRGNLVSVDTSSGSANDWNPGTNGPVYALAVAGGAVCVGGDFSMIGNELRGRLAAVDSSASLLPWNPEPDGVVRALLTSGQRIFVGGDFRNVSGKQRNFAASATMPDGALDDWNPSPNGPVRALAHDGLSVFLGGDFTQIGDHAVAHAASLDLSAGTARNWNANLDGPVHALHYFHRTLYVGGEFTIAGGVPHARLASIDSTTAAVRLWSPAANDTVRAVWFQGGHTKGVGRSVTKTAVFAGGEFTEVSGNSRQGFAALRDPMWSSTPKVRVMRMNGKRVRMRDFQRGHFFTRRHRVTFSGRASSHTEVESVLVRSAARGKKSKTFVAKGATTWRITLRVRSRENAFLFYARDAVYSFPMEFISYSIPIEPVAYVFRLRRGEKPPPAPPFR